MRSRYSMSRRSSGLGRAALPVLGGWSILLLGAAAGVPTVVSFAVCAAVAWAARPTRGAARLRDAAIGAAVAIVGLAHFVGAVVQIGLACGLPETLPRWGKPLLIDWVAVGLLAPFFEEVFYRGALLDALRARLGATAAVVLSAALFAAPHWTPWALLGCFVFGLLLGALRLATGSLPLVIGCHAGANLSVLAALQFPTLRDPLADPRLGVVVLAFLWAGSGLWVRYRATRGSAVARAGWLRRSAAVAGA